MKKLIITLAIGLMAVTAAHAQQAVVIERPGVLSDLVSAAGAIVALPLAAVEGIVVGTAEAAGTLLFTAPRQSSLCHRQSPFLYQ